MRSILATLIFLLSLPGNYLSFTIVDSGSTRRGSTQENGNTTLPSPWIRTMHKLGVKRAIVSLEFDWNGKPENIRVIKILYFDKYDEDCAQITNRGKIAEIELSGLPAELTRAAESPASISDWKSLEGMENAKRGGINIMISDGSWPPSRGWQPLMSPLPS